MGRPFGTCAFATPGKLQRRWGRKLGVHYLLAEPAAALLFIHLVHLQIVWCLNLLRGEREPVVQPARVHDPDGPAHVNIKTRERREGPGDGWGGRFER